MKKWLKKKIFQLFSWYESELFSIDNPWGVKIERGSVFERPLLIVGGSNIFIGENSSLGKYNWLSAYDHYLGDEGFRPRIYIGSGVRIGNYACITAIDSITVSSGCLISDFLYVSDHSHGFDPSINISPMNQPLYSKGSIVIGENCLIGIRVSILPGVVLGKNCIVGSHSVVTKSFPDFTMIAGAPAKAIKKFNFRTKKWEKTI